jgi:lipopolysaccharide/colanic/teichoic acid biosynthesis glycosyltransferase
MSSAATCRWSGRPHRGRKEGRDRLAGEAVEPYLHRHRVKPGITDWAQVSGLRGEVYTLERRTPGSRTVSTTSNTGPLGSI